LRESHRGFIEPNRSSCARDGGVRLAGWTPFAQWGLGALSLGREMLDLDGDADLAAADVAAVWRRAALRRGNLDGADVECGFGDAVGPRVCTATSSAAPGGVDSGLVHPAHVSSRGAVFP
jgi:hypothetical protein